MSKRAESDLPKISIVIPSFNKADYIASTLESITSQNYPNLEIVIQDGGSDDGTVDIIKGYAERFPKVILWQSGKDKGQLDAINRGMEKATGEILTFLNADDIYLDQALFKVAAAFVEYPSALWFAGKSIVIDKKGKEILKPVTFYKNLLLSVNSYTLLLITNYLMQPSLFLTRVGYKKYGPFAGTGDFVTEYNLWLRLGRIQMPTLLPDNIAGFRMSGGNISSVQYRNLLEKDVRIVKKYSKNRLVLALHRLHNHLRVWVVKTL